VIKSLTLNKDYGYNLHIEYEDYKLYNLHIEYKDYAYNLHIELRIMDITFLIWPTNQQGSDIVVSELQFSIMKQ